MPHSAAARSAPHDNLFDLGASSLKLIELHEGIDRAYPGQVDLTELFDHPTIADLARFIESRLAGASPGAGAAIAGLRGATDA